MFRRSEAPVFLAELAASAAYATILHALDRAYEPDWTWATVAGGVVLSTTPAMVLARRQPGDWHDYERRVIAGFCTSGLIIIGWQLWLAAFRRGRHAGYGLIRRLPKEYPTDADRTPPLESAG